MKVKIEYWDDKKPLVIVVTKSEIKNITRNVSLLGIKSIVIL